MPFLPELTPDARILLILGAMFLIGLGADLLGRFTVLPRVTLLLVAGLVIGPTVFGLLPRDFIGSWFPSLTHIALGMIGFLLGQRVTVGALRKRGGKVLAISIGKVFGAALAVIVVLLAIGVELPIALLLGAIAPATAPAATYDVVKESGAEGEFADTLLSVVAVDDAWGLLLFTLMMAIVGTLLGVGSVDNGAVAGLVEVGGSMALGLVLGVPMAYLTGRVREGEPTLAEAMGLVLVCVGTAIWLGLSPILATMVMGSAVSSLARHHSRPFHAIEGVEWPFMILFFVLAGASLDVGHLGSIGWMGGLYIVARSLGLYLGARLGGRLVAAPPVLRRWLGLCLLPQAGVALGMALLAAQRFGGPGEIVLSVILATTVVFEIVAPPITRRVLDRVGASRADA